MRSGPGGTVVKRAQRFGTMTEDLQALAGWLAEIGPDVRRFPTAQHLAAWRPATRPAGQTPAGPHPPGQSLAAGGAGRGGLGGQYFEARRRDAARDQAVRRRQDLGYTIHLEPRTGTG